MSIPRSTQQHFRNANVVFFSGDDGDDDDDNLRPGDQLCPRLINMPSTRYALSVIPVLFVPSLGTVRGVCLLIQFPVEATHRSSLFIPDCYWGYIFSCDWLGIIANNCNIYKYNYLIQRIFLHYKAFVTWITFCSQSKEPNRKLRSWKNCV